MNEQFRLPETALIKRDLCTMKLTSMLQARLCNFSNGVFADVTELVCEPVSFDYIFLARTSTSAGRACRTEGGPRMCSAGENTTIVKRANTIGSSLETENWRPGQRVCSVTRMTWWLMVTLTQGRRALWHLESYLAWVVMVIPCSVPWCGNRGLSIP